MVTMIMDGKSQITATKLKATLLGVLDDVERLGQPVTVTKHGRPVAQIVPCVQRTDLIGSVEFLVSEEELLAPIDVTWNALSE